MGIGGFNLDKHLTNQLAYIPYYNINNQYHINIHGLLIGGRNTTLTLSDFSSGRGSIIDSGTTMLYTDPEIFEKILERFDEFCGANENNCAGTEREENSNCFTPRDLLKAKADFKEWASSFPIFEFEMDNNYIYN